MSASVRARTLTTLAESFAEHIREADREGDERRDYGPGIGPHEERDQLEALVERVGSEDTPVARLDTELPYPGRNERCDLVVSTAEARIPVEAKLLRFRRANGTDEPEGDAKVVSPIKPSGLLVTDSEKLRTSGFRSAGGLLGIRYSAGTEGTPADATRLAEEVRRDGSFWYGFDPETVAVESVDGGAIIAWALPESDDE